jgi:hypothetical protein
MVKSKQENQGLSKGVKQIETPVTNYWHAESGTTKKGGIDFEASPHKFRAIINRWFFDRKKAKRYVLQYVSEDGALGECVIMPNHYILNQTLDTIDAEEYNATVFEFVYEGKTIEGGQSGNMINWLVGIVEKG